MKLVRTGVGVTGTGNTRIGIRGTSSNIGVRGDGDGIPTNNRPMPSKIYPIVR
jgi:hypothetical protein